MSWDSTIHEKIYELEAIATWASIVQLGRVRDYCRMAKAELQRQLDNREEKKAEAGR